MSDFDGWCYEYGTAMYMCVSWSQSVKYWFRTILSRLYDCIYTDKKKQLKIRSFKLQITRLFKIINGRSPFTKCSWRNSRISSLEFDTAWVSDGCEDPYLDIVNWRLSKDFIRWAVWILLWQENGSVKNPGLRVKYCT